MALITSSLGPETNASAILYRAANIYTSSLAAGTIVETLEEDGQILTERRDLAAFRALYAGRANAIFKALNAPNDQAEQRLFDLLSHKVEDLVFKPANLVFAVRDSKKMIRFSHLPGEVDLLSDPIFDFAGMGGGFQTIMVKSDLFAFRSD